MKTGVTNVAGETAIQFENGLTGAGNDSITGSGLANSINGGGGNDTLNGSDGSDTVNGGDGADMLSGGNGIDSLIGGSGNDRLNGGSSIDQLRGGFGDDRYYVNAKHEVIESLNQGFDTVFSHIAYTLGANIEKLVLLGSDNINGTGNGLGNVLVGSAGRNTLNGEAGNDRIDGAKGNDTLNGSVGNDTMTGNLGDDSVLGGTGDDNLAGADGNDNLFGNSGNDTLAGGIGNDTLTAGSGKDEQSGGSGLDTFVFNSTAESGTTVATSDVIADFNAGGPNQVIDQIDLAFIDATPGGSDDAFSFIAGAFSAVGQVRVEQQGADAVVQINTIGTSGAEMIIVLQNTTAASLNAGDFVL